MAGGSGTILQSLCGPTNDARWQLTTLVGPVRLQYFEYLHVVSYRRIIELKIAIRSNMRVIHINDAIFIYLFTWLINLPPCCTGHHTVGSGKSAKFYYRRLRVPTVFQFEQLEAQQYAGIIVNLLRNYQTLLRSGCTNLS